MNRQIKIWNIHTGKLITTLPAFKEELTSCLTFAPDYKTLAASGSINNSVIIWILETSHLQVDGHSDNVKSIAFSPDGSILASGSEDCTIKLWTTDTMENILTLSAHDDDAVMSLAFTPNGRYLTSGSGDTTIKVWDLNDGQLILTMRNTDTTKAFAFNPVNGMLASGSNDGIIRLWDLESRTLVRELTGHKGWIYSLAFSPNGRILASTSQDKTIRLWGKSDAIEEWDYNFIPF